MRSDRKIPHHCFSLLAPTRWWNSLHRGPTTFALRVDTIKEFICQFWLTKLAPSMPTLRLSFLFRLLLHWLICERSPRYSHDVCDRFVRRGTEPISLAKWSSDSEKRFGHTQCMRHVNANMKQPWEGRAATHGIASINAKKEVKRKEKIHLLAQSRDETIPFCYCCWQRLMKSMESKLWTKMNTKNWRHTWYCDVWCGIAWRAWLLCFVLEKYSNYILSYFQNRFHRDANHDY